VKISTAKSEGDMEENLHYFGFGDMILKTE
jgi:hypothetical protein